MLQAHELSTLGIVEFGHMKPTSRALWMVCERHPLASHDEQLAEQLPCTRRTLERRFAAEHGHPIHEEIIVCRLSRARRLLRETDLPVKSVAYLAGFTSRERMRVAFQSRESCSPDQYRRGVRLP